MFGKKEYVGLTIQDDVIRLARVRVDGKDLRLIKLDQYSLVEKLKNEGQRDQAEDTSAEAFEEFDEERAADSIFGLDEEEEDDDNDIDLSDLEEEAEQEDEMGLDMVEESGTAQSNELQIYNILMDIESDKINLGLNVPAGHTIFQVIRDTNFKEVKKKDLIEDLEDKLESIYGQPKSPDNYSYEIREDGSLLLGSIDEESVTLRLLNQARELYSGKLNVENVLPDEIVLVGLVRSNYDLPEDEMTGVIEFGKETCRVVFMKGNDIWLVSPIINEGTNNRNFLNTVFSKILFQLDTGEVPSLDRMILANNTRGESAVEFFKKNFPDIHVEDLEYQEGFVDTENIDSSSVPSFTTAIGAAVSASGLRDDSFPQISFVPKYVIDRQKIFQLQWHGMLILLLIFLTPITINFFYNQNARKIDSLSSELNQMNNQIEKLTPIVNQANQVSNDLSTLKDKLVMLDTLTQGSREWSQKLAMLNQGVNDVGATWITSFSENADGALFQGFTMYRNRIPKIVNLFNQATLLSVNIQDIREQEVFNFSISVKEFTKSDSIYSPPTPEEVKTLIGK